MKIKVQLVLCAEDGHEEQVHEIAMVEKPHQRIEHLGFTLAEAKSILKTLQQHLVEQQATAFIAAHAQCDHCGKALGIKGYHTRTFRTLFGTATLTSPCLYHCRCQRRKTTTFRPLNALLTDSVAPELLLMETKWASLVSYGLTAQALKDFLPVDTTLNATTIQNHTLTVAQRCEDELGEEQWAFVEGCPANWETLPIPDGPITVGIDGGYVRDWHEKKSHFEVIVGKSILAFRRDDEDDIPSSTCFGFVQTLDTKPKRRLFEVLQSQGHQMNQQITFLSDGGDTVRDLQLYLNPHAEHLLDWFHLAMRLTVLQQTAKGLPEKTRDEEEDYPLRDPEAPQSHRGVSRLHRQQCRVYSELWRALPLRRAHQRRLCGIDRESSDQQALLQAAADAEDQTRDAPALANAGQDPQPRTGCRIQALVSRSAAGGGTLGSLTPRVLMLS